MTNYLITDFRLIVFQTVYAKRNFTKAAQELNISQPAVTKQIGELERLLGVTLFLRQKGGIAPTIHAEKLLLRSSRILEQYALLTDDFANQNKLNGTIRMGASTTVSQYLIPSIIAGFRQQYPTIQIDLHSGNSQQIEQMLQNRAIDIGLIEGRSISTALRYEKLCPDQIVLTVAHPRWRPEEITIDKLRTLPLLLRETGSGTLEVVEHALQEQGVRLSEMNIIAHLGSTESIKRYLYASEAFAFLSITAITEELKENKLFIIETPQLNLEREFRFVSLHGQHAKIVELFKQYCKTSLNKTNGTASTPPLTS